MEEEIKHYAVVNKTTSIVENVILGTESFKFIFESENLDVMLLEYIEKFDNDEYVARIGETYIPEVGFIFVSKAVPTIIPKSITMRQARLALLAVNLLATVAEAIATGTDEVLKVEWEYASEVRRDWVNLINMATSLGMTEEQLDDLFIKGSKL